MNTISARPPKIRLPLDARREIIQALPGPVFEIGKFQLPESMVIHRLRCSFSERILILKTLCAEQLPQSGIVFVSTRLGAENLAKYFEQWNISTLIYHAGMSQEERISLENQLEEFQQGGRGVIMIATSAFGMGMDYSFLKFCILFEPSFNLLSLAQSLGRVGRSGEAVKSWVLWHEDDFLRYGWMTGGSAHRERELKWVQDWCRSRDRPHLMLEKYFNGIED